MARLKLHVYFRVQKRLWAFLLKTYRTDKEKKKSNMHLQTELCGFLTNNQTKFTLWPEANIKNASSEGCFLSVTLSLWETIKIAQT